MTVPTAREIYEALRVLSRTVRGYRGGLAPDSDEWLKMTDILGRLADGMAVLERAHGLPGPEEER